MPNPNPKISQEFLDQQGKGRSTTDRTERIILSLTPENKQFIDNLAEQHGIKRPDAFELILEIAKKTLEKNY